jgi:hypothetical protein
MGVAWRSLGAPGVERLGGAGVYYGASPGEARALAGEDVYVVGGANSAGQAVVAFAEHAARVHMLVRGAGLRESMSRYLSDRIATMPNVTVHAHTEVAAAHGAAQLEGLTLRDARTGAERDVTARSLFVFIGAEPRTAWLDGVLARDEHGFLLTGPDLAGPDVVWPPGAARRAAGRPAGPTSVCPSHSRPTCRASSWPATSGTTRTAAWRRPWARGAWRCRSSTATSARRACTRDGSLPRSLSGCAPLARLVSVAHARSGATRLATPALPVSSRATPKPVARRATPTAGRPPPDAPRRRDAVPARPPHGIAGRSCLVRAGSGVGVTPRIARRPEQPTHRHPPRRSPCPQPRDPDTRTSTPTPSSARRRTHSCPRPTPTTSGSRRARTACWRAPWSWRAWWWARTRPRPR